MTARASTVCSSAPAFACSILAESEMSKLDRSDRRRDRPEQGCCVSDAVAAPRLAIDTFERQFIRPRVTSILSVAPEYSHANVTSARRTSSGKAA